MSRSNYSEDLDNWALIKWRGMVTSATRGKRGQKFFIDLLAALDAMPDKRLITGELQQDGEVCAIGSLGVARGIDMSKLDPTEPDAVAETFNIATCLAQEVVYQNDECEELYGDQLQGWTREDPEKRWKRMREWVAKQVAATDSSHKASDGGER